jgi:threonine dehydrogenase-like Zn-dependent dehydrogenase
MTLIGSRNPTGEHVEHVVACIESGDLPTDKLHTHSCTLVEMPQQLPAWSASPYEVIKAIAII